MVKDHHIWSTTRIDVGTITKDAEHEPLSDGSVINLFADDTLFY